MRKVLNFWLKLLLSLLFTFILIEVGLRLFPGLIPPGLLVKFNPTLSSEIATRLGLPAKRDTILLARDDNGPELRIFKPHAQFNTQIKDTNTLHKVALDDQGFCNPPEDSYSRDHIDLITLGDSFTFCHAVNPAETWTSYLGRHTPYSVYNLGVFGIGIHEDLQIFKRFGLAKSPKIVIINIYEGNDFRDAANYYYYLLDAPNRKDKPDAAAPSPAWAGITETIGATSYAYNLITALAASLPGASQPQTTAASQPKKSSERDKINFRYKLVFADGAEVPFNLENTDTDEVQYAQRLAADKIDPGVFWAIDQAFQQYAALAKAHNFIPVIAYTPSVYTAYAANVVFEDARLNQVMPWFSQEQRRYIQSKCQQYGFTFIDVTPDLQAAASANGPNNLLYYRYDLHLTPAGHAVVGDSITQGLKNLRADGFQRTQ